MSYDTPSEKFADWFFARFIFPLLMVCILCIACVATFALCRWLLAPSPDIPIAAFYGYLADQDQIDKGRLTRGDITSDFALKRRAERDLVHSHLAAFLESPR